MIRIYFDNNINNNVNDKQYNLMFPHHVTFNWYCCHLRSPTNDMLLPLCFEAAVFWLWGGNYLPFLSLSLFLSWDFFFNCLALQLFRLTTSSNRAARPSALQSFCLVNTTNHCLFAFLSIFQVRIFRHY